MFQEFLLQQFSFFYMEINLETLKLKKIIESTIVNMTAAIHTYTPTGPTICFL
jgi:hypothetical protein